MDMQDIKNSRELPHCARLLDFVDIESESSCKSIWYVKNISLILLNIKWYHRTCFNDESSKEILTIPLVISSEIYCCWLWILLAHENLLNTLMLKHEYDLKNNKFSEFLVHFCYPQYCRTSDLSNRVMNENWIFYQVFHVKMWGKNLQQ